jgi:hypothetical protein
LLYRGRAICLLNGDVLLVLPWRVRLEKEQVLDQALTNTV